MGSSTYTEKTDLQPLIPGIYLLDRSTGVLTPTKTTVPGRDIVLIGPDHILQRVTLLGEMTGCEAQEIVKRVFPGRCFELLDFYPTATVVDGQGLKVSEFVTGTNVIAGTAEDESPIQVGLAEGVYEFDRATGEFWGFKPLDPKGLDALEIDGFQRLKTLTFLGDVGETEARQALALLVPTHDLTRVALARQDRGKLTQYSIKHSPRSED